MEGGAFAYAEHKNHIKLGLAVVCFIALLAVVAGSYSTVPASTMVAVWISFLCTLALGAIEAKDYFKL